MHDHRRTGIQGFFSATLVVIYLVFVLMVLKWKASAATKKGESRKLLVSEAQETAALVEGEGAYMSDYSVTVETPPQYECAVCFRTASKRCGRCKVLRYCSGKCQIIHWRQGHKEECQPPDICTSFLFVSTPKTEFNSTSSLLEPTEHRSVSCTEKDAPMPYTPICEISGCEVPKYHRVSSSSARSSSTNAMDPITGTLDFVRPVLDNASSKIFQKDLSCSVDTDSCSDYFLSSGSYENDLHNSMSITHNNPTSGNRLLDLHTVKTVSNNPSSATSRLCEMDTSRPSTSICSGLSNISTFDEACRRSFTEDVPNSANSRYNLDKDKSMSLLGKDTSSCLDTTTEFQNVRPTEIDGSVSLLELRSSRGSLSTGTIRRSIGSAIQYFSRHKARTSSQTKSNHLTGSDNAISSSTPSSVGFSQNTSIGFKRSVKKVLHRAKLSKASKQAESGRVNGVVAKPSQILFPYECFVELFNWSKLELYPCGLVNCGNSCYANVVLQCLTYTRPLAAYLLQGYHSEHCKRRNWCFMCELEHLLLMVRQGESPLSPTRILSQIQRMRSQLGDGRQEDAHELLRISIDSMQSICLDEVGGEKLVDQTMQKTTFIQQMFGGSLQSKVQCMRCYRESLCFENMLDLTVEIHGDIESLEDALAQFTASELLDGENKYKCNRCKFYVKAKKQLAVHEAPNILTIALKRFKNGKFGKLNKHVPFPEVLDISPYMSGTGDTPPLYMLYAVVVHVDMLNASFFGHYVCYVKDMHGAWYKIDDAEVQPVQLHTVMSESAYILLYSRSSPRPPNVQNNEIAQSCIVAPINYHKYDSWQSFASNGHNGSFDRNVISSLNSSTARLDEIHSDFFWNSNDDSRDVYVSDALDGDAYGFNYERAPLATTDWDSNPGAREYTYFTYSDAVSLLSGSDAASWSTESYGDSTGTIDHAEIII